MFETLFEHWTESQLSAIGLRRDKGKICIVIPPNANIYHMTVGAQIQAGNGHKSAMIYENSDGIIDRYTFDDIDRTAHNLAAYLAQRGYGRGDYIGVHTGMTPMTGIAHMAIYKLGAVAVTLSQFYGPQTLAHALNDCGAKCLLTNIHGWAALRDNAPTLFPHLTDILVADNDGTEPDLWDIVTTTPNIPFVPTYTGADDIALLMYTSGSTGMPKGILHGHRVLASYVPSISLFFNVSSTDADAVFYSPSDWAWVGGLLDMLFPAWLAGRPVATTDSRFGQEQAYDFMARHKVTHTFLAPTAIKRLARCDHPRQQYDLSLRVICTGGEALAAETLTWAENQLGVVCNEFYGMTEVNHLIGNCCALYPRKAGSMGVAYPGHQVVLVDENGTPVPDGEPGEIVTTGDSPTRYLGYLNNSAKEAEIRLGPWMRTYDLAVRDSDGYFWYKGRSDDLIKSSGMRIGPAEIEECLLSHNTVVEVAVIGKSDPDRGQIVKAFVRTKDDIAGDDALTQDLQNHVRTHLAPYKTPREIVYVDSFEMTTSGKINRKKLRLQEQEL